MNTPTGIQQQSIPGATSLPTGLQEALSIPMAGQGAQGAQNMGNPALYGLNGQDMGAVYGYANGGLIGQGGAPVPPQGAGLQAGQQAQALSPADVEAELNRFMQQQPQQVQQIQQIFMELIMSGELQPDMLNLIEQMAMAALQNPQLYPQLRQYAIQNGLATEQDISSQYDQGLLFVLLLAARATKMAMQGQGIQSLPTQQQPPVASYAKGGLVTPHTSAKAGGKVAGPGTGTSDSVPIRVSAGEYVIPAHVVRAKGTEFFDKMLASYETPPEKA